MYFYTRQFLYHLKKVMLLNLIRTTLSILTQFISFRSDMHAPDKPRPSEVSGYLPLQSRTLDQKAIEKGLVKVLKDSTVYTIGFWGQQKWRVHVGGGYSSKYYWSSCKTWSRESQCLSYLHHWSEEANTGPVSKSHVAIPKER